MNDQVLAAVARYGSPALFIVVAIAAIGAPLPVTLLLIVTGSLAAQGVVDIRLAIAVASLGSVVGDQIGYAIGRWGGRAALTRFGRLLGSRERIRSFDEMAKGWGGAGVFFSRWLITAAGPWINLASGAAGYPWIRFTLWDFLGESFGAALYICLGLVFSDRVQAIGALLADLSWSILGLVAASLLGWKLFARRVRGAPPVRSEEPTA